MDPRYRVLPASLLIFSLFFAFLAHTAAAQYRVFLDLAGVNGSVTVPGYEDEIEVSSYAHGISMLILFGGGGGGQAAPPSHSDISFTKMLGIETAPMLAQLNTGSDFATARFDFVTNLGPAAKSDAGQMPMVVLRVKLDEAYLTFYSTSWGSGSSSLEEAWGLVYRKITLTYDPNGPNPQVFSYDVETGTELAASVEGVRFFVDGDDVVFSWRTLSETGNYGFEIQHLEGQEYRRAAYIPAAGWSSEPLEYDVRIRGLQPGIHSFRLASLGVDGNVAYSGTMQVALGVPEGTTLAIAAPFPNPFSTSTNVVVTSDRTQAARVSVFDALGREVQVLFDGVLESGGQTKYTFEAEQHLARGLYMISVQTENGMRSRPVVLGR